ncbi:MAG: DNA-directed RNA polymerase, subunit E'' [Thaumarchaeota archaeon]|nr:DNA-directed RNA polymerase, subunit E'' [Nitrososphaerota archaeon]
MKELACRRCKMLTSSRTCPNDGSKNLSEQWSGLIVVLEPAKSKVARTLGILAPGRYALNVG